ncbi:hypothetical protein Tco_0782328 [Tanacetum coccineum]
MSFSKRPGKNTPRCYTKPLDSLKNWNNRFFWVDERIFPIAVEWRTNAPKDGMPSTDSYSAADVATLNTRHMDLFNLISAPNPTKVKTGTRPRAAHEVSLLTITASRVINMEDKTVASGSSGTPSALEKLPLDFANENPPPLINESDGTEDQVQDELSRGILPVENPTTTEVVLEPDLEKEVAAMRSLVNKRHRKRGNDEDERKCTTQETPADAKSVSDPDPLSYAKPQPHPERDVAQSSRKTATEIPTEKVATKELDQEIKSIRAVEAEVHDLHNQTKSLEALLKAELATISCPNRYLTFKHKSRARKEIKAAFEEFKKYEDDKVEQRCAEMDASLDKLSVDFDEELYPHKLTVIEGHRWVIGHGLRLAVMKCSESPELRQAFADVVSAGLVKGINEGLKHGIDHGKADQDLAVIEAYDPEADNKYVKALQDLKVLKISWRD